MVFCILVSKGRSTWREEDPSHSEVPRRQTTFRLVYICSSFGQGGYQVEKESKRNSRPLAAERPAAAMFIVLSLILASYEQM